MAVIAPFCGFRYNPDVISDFASVTSPPNDRISDELNSQLCQRSEYNIVKLGFSETANGIADHEKYTQGAKLLESWIEDKILIRDKKPAIYIYEQIFSMNNNLQSLKGIISLVRLEEYSEKVILPHQKTSLRGYEHRQNLIKSTRANISPIYSLYNDDISISSLIVSNSARNPDISFVSAEGITQNLWIVDDEEFISAIQKKFENKQIFIADGHHRYETNLEYRNELRVQSPEIKDAPYNYTMMALMPMYSSGLFVLPTHRLVKGVENFDENILITSLTEDFKVSRIYFTESNYEETIIKRISDVIDEKYLGLYTGKDYYYLLKPGGQFKSEIEIKENLSVYERLEATLFNSLILEKYLRLSQAQLEDANFVTYTRSAKEAIKEVQLQNYQCAFFLNSTKVDELRAVAEAGDMMPLKSTFFWPKAITGLVIYKFD